VRGALTHLFRGAPAPRGPRGPDRSQLALDLDAPRGPAASVAPVPSPPPPPRREPAAAPAAPAALRSAEELLARLRALGLPAGVATGGIDRCRLTRNRTVMVSFRAGELRVHRGYLAAPEPVLEAIVRFVRARTRAQRAAAQRAILAYPVQRGEGGDGAAARPRARERTRPEDEPMVRVLVEWHRRYNDRHFGGVLRTVPIRVSRRLKRRLGHYTAASASAGLPAEIVIGRSHIRRHGWEEALHTLLHEMVHQWQDESGLPIDHGAGFRRKAREVGITAAARRVVGQRGETAA
jgi:SprT-like family